MPSSVKLLWPCCLFTAKEQWLSHKYFLSLLFQVRSTRQAYMSLKCMKLHFRKVKTHWILAISFAVQPVSKSSGNWKTKPPNQGIISQRHFKEIKIRQLLEKAFCTKLISSSIPRKGIHTCVTIFIINWVLSPSVIIVFCVLIKLWGVHSDSGTQMLGPSLMEPNIAMGEWKKAVLCSAWYRPW